MIDKNKKEMEVLRLCLAGENEKGMKLQEEFLKEVEETVEDHCPCQEACPLHGNCQACVIVHRGHADHLPFCFHGLINERLEAVASLTEHKLTKKF